jgi:hypothetical protein
MKLSLITSLLRAKTTLLLFGLTAFLAMNGVTVAQAITLQDPDKSNIRERIAMIMKETLQQGKGTVDGVKYRTKVLPSMEHIKEIQSYGDEAIPVLEEYLLSDNERASELAMRFLGSLGDSRIIRPLQNIILYNNSPIRRELALRWLAQAPWTEVAPIIREAAEKDENTHVREIAKQLLIEGASKSQSQ